LLLGTTVDTNAAWIGRRLAARGIPVVRRHTVGDDADEIRRAVSDAAEVADLVLVTGGLGPTPDDLTRDAVAAWLGLPLLEDPEVLRSIEIRFRQRGVTELPSPNRRVAQVPQGARKLANPVGTAPGLVLDHEDSVIVLLPGVPSELRAIVEVGLEETLTASFSSRLRPVFHRVIHTTGIPESLLSAQVTEVLGDAPQAVRLAFLPDVRGVDLRLTVTSGSRGEAEELMDGVEDRLRATVEPWRFEADRGDLADAVSFALRRAGLRLAVAESCTGGLVAKRITDLEGSSEVLEGGIVAYANEVKVRHLGVDPAVLDGEGAVSEVVARQMALGVASRFGVACGLAITGVAGPGGGTEAKPVGTVWIAASVPGRIAARLERFPGDRADVRERAAQAALFLLLRLLDGRLEA
ncbi:MAG: CinA family nicotinamide mononucleotide deamidase-related protein, partial [Gemmatimonadota bacterium]